MGGAQAPVLKGNKIHVQPMTSRKESVASLTKTLFGLKGERGSATSHKTVVSLLLLGNMRKATPNLDILRLC